MNDFIQMDIFFFIASTVALIILFFITVIGIYLVVIIRKIKNMTQEFEKFLIHTTNNTKELIEMIKQKLEEILNKGGIIERVVATVLGTILAKTFQNHGKIKKDARGK